MDGYRKKLIEMLNYLDKICQVNNIRYYAIGGTFLGAIRHNGFIPWDDDIDVCMPRKDYNKFAEIVNSSADKYIVETPRSLAKDYCYSVSKLYDTSTTLIEGVKYQTKRGIYIDVFPLDGIGNSGSEIDRNYRKIDFWNAVFSSRTSVVRQGRAAWKNLLIKVAGLIPSSILNEKKLLVKLDNLCCKFDYDECDYVGVLLTQYRKKYIMPKYLFAETKRYKFENTTIVGVKDYDTYLKLLFGNWHNLPPKEKQVAGHDFHSIDLESSYLEN